jgi:hypothetical protein
VLGVALEQALRAEAVAEFGLGVLRNVGLELASVALVVADPLAVRADREEAAEESSLRLGAVEHLSS